MGREPIRQGAFQSSQPSSPLVIPFNRPSISAAEREAVSAAMDVAHLAGDGPFTSRCNRLIAELLGSPAALLTTSCTHALEMAALLLGVGPGDEVIVPSFTFVSTANAFALRGARPIFVDIRSDTLNIDEQTLDRALSKRTRAIVAVHYAGVGCEMDSIVDLAQRRRIAVVEDNAHGLFGTYKDRFLGTFGCLATQSFHETKNLTCGEGGALVINDVSLAPRAEILREKGTNRSRFFRGEVDKYTWVDLGSSYLPSEILSAMLLAQLNRRDEIQAKRRAIWLRYRDGLAEWAESRGIMLPRVPDHCRQSFHMFYILLHSLAERQALMSHLKERGVQSAFHYVPLHLSEMGRRFGGNAGQCPVTEDISERLLRLPFFTDLSVVEQDEVIAAILSFGLRTTDGQAGRVGS